MWAVATDGYIASSVCLSVCVCCWSRHDKTRTDPDEMLFVVSTHMESCTYCWMIHARFSCKKRPLNEYIMLAKWLLADIVGCWMMGFLGCVCSCASAYLSIALQPTPVACPLTIPEQLYYQCWCIKASNSCTAWMCGSGHIECR